MRKQEHAFTLTEILVVIAIIGVLLAMAMPVFTAVKTSAQNAKCASNLRATAAAIHLLAADRNNTFRSFLRGNQGTGDLIWGKALLDGHYIADKRALRCPAGACLYPLENGAWYWNTYGFNMLTADGAQTAPQGAGQSYELKFSAVTNPALRVMLVDSSSLAFFQPGLRSQTFRVNISKSTDGIQLRHGNKANALFMDGHMEAMNRERAEKFFNKEVIYDANDR